MNKKIIPKLKNCIVY